MTFKPWPCRDRWLAVLLLAALVALAVLAAVFIAHRPIDGASFVAGMLILSGLPLLAYLGFRTVGAFTLEYWVDRDAVTVIWGVTRQVIPLAHIDRFVMGTDTTLVGRAGWWHWPCSERSRRSHQALGVLNSYATRPLDEQVILVTPDECFGLSPRDRDAFIEAVQTRFALGTARPLRPELVRPPLWTWPLWRDRTAMALIGAGLLGLMIMFGVLCVRFPGLSSDLPLHFNVLGVPDRIAPKSNLFTLPFIGLITWLLNLVAGVWIYRHIQRGGAYLLWGGAVVVQLIAGVALINLMRW